MKITKKEKKIKRRLTVQKARVDKLEEAILDGIGEWLPPYTFPVQHHFADGVYCREVFIHKGCTVVGVVHKISSHFVLAKGKIRFAWGNGIKDVEAPALCKNDPGQKNAVYALEDCLIYQFTPNPGNSTDLLEVYGYVTNEPELIQGMPGNKQEKKLCLLAQ